MGFVCERMGLAFAMILKAQMEWRLPLDAINCSIIFSLYMHYQKF